MAIGSIKTCDDRAPRNSPACNIIILLDVFAWVKQMRYDILALDVLASGLFYL